ncbi:MAG: 2-oxo acid dehydrogenase subunit E2 [Anaerolineales bacterium]|nr:2-oxo acid dehydrogenase subunit E2 [Anaerolineales bacterium]MCA9931970.1 2-oxo acid dehydrogenase subunit E2 [Anaerolineales bacterium]
MAFKVVMPEMGEGVIEGLVSRWLKFEGDEVEQYEPLLEIETDKVTTEATAETGGTLLQILVPEGTTVEVGTVLALIGEPGEGVPTNGGHETAVSAPPTQPAATPVPTKTFIEAPPPPKPYTGRISPVVGRIAAEHEVDLNMVAGTGRNGRITKKDILAYIENRDQGLGSGEREEDMPQPAAGSQPELSPQSSALSPQSSILSPQPSATVTPSPGHLVTPSSSPLPGEILALTGMRRSIAEHMVRSKQISPHVTTVFEFDFTNVDKHRRANKEAFARDGAHLTFTAYIVAATVQALKQHPLVNSTWTDDGIKLLREINIGMATALDEGLIVPVIKNADSLNLLGIARVVNDLANRARNKALKPNEVQDGTFTLTNHGTSGSLFATPIINQPQCGILGTGKIEKRVKVINDAIAIRTMAYVSFTFDHRILDGATADYFVASIKDVIENWH